MYRKPFSYEVDTSETSIRIWVLSAVMIGWFLWTSLDTFSYIATYGHPYGGGSLYDWVSMFISDYLIFMVMIICYLLAEWNIERRFNFQQLPLKYDYVNSTVLDAYRSLDLKDPLEVRFLDLEEPYSFTYGKRSKEAKLVLSKGLIEALDKEELKSVVLHELSHIKNGDLVFMTWGVTLLKALKYWLLIRLLFIPMSIVKYYLEGELWKYVEFYINITIPTVIAMITIFVVLPLLVINSVSRIREFLADTYACEFVEEKYLRSSLTKISKAIILLNIKRSLFPSHLSIVSFSPSNFPNVILQHTIATHPSIKERIEAVEKSKYIVSWRNACKIDRRAVYAGIIAYIIVIIAYIIALIVDLVGEVGTDFYIFFTVIIPLLFIFWVNGRQFLHLLERIPSNMREKMLGLLRTLVRNLISTSTLIGVQVSVLGVSYLLGEGREPTSLFWISLPDFLVFAVFAFLYAVGTGCYIIFEVLWSRIRRK